MILSSFYTVTRIVNVEEPTTESPEELVASDFWTTICHLAIVNVCVIIILSLVNTQISIPLLCFPYLFVELMITMNE